MRKPVELKRRKTASFDKVLYLTTLCPCFHERSLIRLLLAKQEGFVTKSQLLETRPVYTELINQSRPHTTGGLKFSRKASAGMLHRNDWKITDFLTPLPNAGRCQFASCDVDPNPP